MSSRGLILWAIDSLGNPVKVLADPDGTLRVDGTISVSGTVDVSDRPGRLVGIVYGSLGQLLQRTSTLDLLVQLRNAGVEIDPRQIRLLTSADVISAVQSGAWSVGVTNLPTDYFKAGQSIGNTGFNASNLLNPHPVSLASIPNPSNLDVALSTRLKISDYALTQELGKIGIILTAGGAIIDPRSTRALTSSDIITAYGSQTQALLQRASTYDLIVQLRSAGVEIDPRSIRALAKATDEVYSVLRTDAGAAYDARQIRALTSSDVVDIVDKAARLLGVVYGSQGQQLQQRALTYDLLVAIRQGGSELSTSNPIFAGIVDASGNRLPSMDAAARRGYVTVTDGTNVMPTMDASARPGYVDMIDKAARLLGVVYGSQGQQLLQRATTYDLLVQLRTAGAEYDARQIRALTSADVVTVQQTNIALLQSYTRWGIPREPVWINGTNQTAPGTSTDLVTKTVTGGKTGRIFGWHIIADEAKEFILNVGATAYRIGALSGEGVIFIESASPVFDNIAATTVINIRVASAGASGKVYRADLFYDEA